MHNINPWKMILEIRRFNQKKFGKISEMKTSFDMTIGLVFQAIFNKVFDFGREQIGVKVYSTNDSGYEQVKVIVDTEEFKFYTGESRLVFDKIVKKLIEYGIPFMHSYESENKNGFIVITLN